MSIITLWKVNIFSIGKELYESIMILANVWLILSVTPLSSLITYLILLQILSHHPQSNNAKYLISSWILISPSISSNLIPNGFAPVEVLYGMS